MVDITPREFDLQQRDTDYIPYLTVSILVIGLVLAGILQSGTAAARSNRPFSTARPTSLGWI